MDPHAMVRRRLIESGIEHRLYEHEPTLTSLQAAEYRGVHPSTGAKSLVIRSKDGMALFVIPGDAQLDWKKVRAAGYRGARLADDGELLVTTGLTKGAVSPLGGLFGLPVFVDRVLTELELVRFNVASHTESVEIRGADLQLLTGATVGDYRVTSG